MPEEPCQCPDCQRFYREHDRLIREFPTLRQQQELKNHLLQQKQLAQHGLELDDSSSLALTTSLDRCVKPGDAYFNKLFDED